MKLTNFNYLGFEYAEDIDISDMEYIHIDVLPTQAMQLGITPIMRNGAEKSTSVGTLTVNEWNSFDLPIADFGFDLTYNLTYKSFQLKIDKGTGSETVYVDNIYFWKGDGGETPDPQPTTLTDISTDENGMHKLKGTWDATVFAAIDATAKANSYDLTEVTHDGTIDVIDKTDNPYCIFVTPVAGTVNRNEAVKTDNGYQGYAFFFQEKWNDGKTYDINTAISPINVSNPFFQRLFDRAGYYITMTVPFNYNNIPDANNGTKFFELAASSGNNNITFKEVTSIEANKPYLVYVGTGGITIPDAGNVTIDFMAETSTYGNTAFVANYKNQLLSNGYVLPTGVTEESDIIFKKADNAKLKPFRAYINNVNAGARINVFFDDVTGIHAATAEQLNQLFNIYSIDGKLVNQNRNSVTNLKSGVYIINGKKVVVK